MSRDDDVVNHVERILCLARIEPDSVTGQVLHMALDRLNTPPIETDGEFASLLRQIEQNPYESE